MNIIFNGFVNLLLLLTINIIDVFGQSSHSKGHEDKSRQAVSVENVKHLNVVGHKAHGVHIGHHDRERLAELQASHRKARDDKSAAANKLEYAKQQSFAREFKLQSVTAKDLSLLKTEANKAGREHYEIWAKQEDAVDEYGRAISKGHLLHQHDHRSASHTELNSRVAEASVHHSRALAKHRAAVEHHHKGPK